VASDVECILRALDAEGGVVTTEERHLEAALDIAEPPPPTYAL